MRSLAAVALLAVSAALLGVGPRTLRWGSTAPASAAQLQRGSSPGSTVVVEPVRIPVTATSGEAITVDADLYLPAGEVADALPAVISAHGFGGSKRTDAARHELLARAGYAVLAPSSRGFGDTGGAIALASRDHEVADAVQLIDWLTTRPEIALDAAGDPLVGVVGASYGGALGLQLAQVDPRVQAVVAIDTWHSLQSALLPNHALGPAADATEGAGVFKRQWAGLLLAAAGGCEAFVPLVCQAYTEVGPDGRLSEAAEAFLRQASPGSQALHQQRGGIPPPTLLVQGLRDTLFPPEHAARTAADIARGGGQVSLLWTSGGHGFALPAAEQEAVLARTLSWLDAHLRGAAVDTGPRFAYPDLGQPAAGTEAAPGRFVAGDALPVIPSVPRADETAALALSADGSLSTDLDGARAGAIPVTVDPGTPSFSSLPGVQALEPFSARPASDPAGTFVEFRGHPLEVPVSVVGIPSVEGLVIRATEDGRGRDVVLFAKLYDEAPDGTSELVGRQVAPVRVAPGTGPAAFTLTGMAHRFNAGHRIRLVLAAGDAAYAPAPAGGSWSVEIDPVTARLHLPADELIGVDPVSAPDEPAAAGGDAAGFPVLPLAIGGGAVAAAVVLGTRSRARRHRVTSRRR